jgi:hypothetical protein
MSDAAIGYGSKFELGNGADPEVLTEIAEVFDITPPNESTDTIDVTHMQSPDAMREFIMGLTDPGEISFELNFVPGSTSETAILAARASRQKRGGVITIPNGWTWSFDMLVTGYEPAVPNEDKMTATVTGKVTGGVVRAAGA